MKSTRLLWCQMVTAGSIAPTLKRNGCRHALGGRRSVTSEQIVKAAQFLAGLAAQADQQGRNVVTLPTATVRRLSDVLLDVVNQEAA